MTKILHRFRRHLPTDAEKAAEKAAEETAVTVDVERIQHSMQAPRFVMPSGLTPEEKRQFMLAVANGHR